MKFPRLMFRSPGPEQCQGGTYAHMDVADQDELDAALTKGWHATLPDALSPPAPSALPPTAPIAESKAITQAEEGAPTTRDEMKCKADELGLTYPHNISNIKLAELIDAALAKG